MTEGSVGIPATSPADMLGLDRIDDYRWRVRRHGGMKVEGLIFANVRLLGEIGSEAVQQVANVACLPGIVGRSIGMPDIHWGYGFAIGGVAAFDPDSGGVISPGGVGYDINCGVRLLRSDLPAEELRPRIPALINQIMRDVPAGIGSHHRSFELTLADVRAVMEDGAAWVVQKGWGDPADLNRTEAGGRMSGADPDHVSARAIERGRRQLGTVGSGNHFIEIGYVDQIFDADAAAAFGLVNGMATVLIHSGSRGLGYQVCDDHLQTILAVAVRYGIDLPDRQLACAPLGSAEAGRYLGAMNAAANYAFANRQLMAHRVREAFARVLSRPPAGLGLSQVYDVAHNMAKWEVHDVAGQPRRVCVHRKGATRAFPAGHPDVPDVYRAIGQPVLIPGDMARCSFVLAGTDRAFRETFGSCCHGAGRRLSRHRAKDLTKGRDLRGELRSQGVEVRASSFATIAEEVPEAYKDVSEVVEVVHGAGIGRKVARLRPLAVLKG
jgi:tRNA-splicing ligase RtcB (3'-phosphate/5'-hydroxy nucleic acid ligase)